MKRTENGRARPNAKARPSRISPSDSIFKFERGLECKAYSEVVKPLSQGGAVAGGVKKARVLEYDRRAKAFNKKYREEQEISRRVFMVS